MGFHHSSGYSLKSQISGDFHRPYGTLMILDFTIHRTSLPQSRPFGRDSSLREGAGRGFHHSSGYSLKSGVSGDFHRPYGTLVILDFNIHRTTLPQSRPLGVTAPSEREPGWGLHHSSGYSLKSNVAGDFHRPYEGSEYFTAQKNPPVSAGGAIPGGAGHLPYRNPPKA